jgi:hypothetical protein
VAANASDFYTKSSPIPLLGSDYRLDFAELRILPKFAVILQGIGCNGEVVRVPALASSAV